MKRITLTDTERLEIENSVLREAYQQEKLAHAETQVLLQKEALANASTHKERLVEALVTRYKLEGCTGFRFGDEGRFLECDERPPQLPPSKPRR